MNIKFNFFSSDLYKDLSSTKFDEDDIFEIANQKPSPKSISNSIYH